MQVGVEHYGATSRDHGHALLAAERLRPVASWSSLEFRRRWKALHHSARKFYAPALAPRMYLRRKTVGIGTDSKVLRGVELYTTAIAAGRFAAWCVGSCFTSMARCACTEKTRVLRAGESVRQKNWLSKGRSKSSVARIFYLRIAFESDGVCLP